MNWGYKIFFALAFFFVFMGYLVVRSFQENIDLVTEDYYQQELAFQDRIDKVKNTEALSKKVMAELTGDGIRVSFPNEAKGELSGQVQLYRPSEASNDKFYDLDGITDKTITIPPSDFRSGKYKLKIDWRDSSKSYFQEIELMIPG